jgi:iron complex transport system permease protein
MRPLTLWRLLIRCGVLAAVLLVVVVVALKFGAVPVSLYGLGRDLVSVLLGHTNSISSDYGASLAVAGTSFQALLRNPLADPFVLGVSSGAALGAVLALIAEPHLAVPPSLAAMFTPLGAFLGAAATVAVVYFLGRREGQIDSGTLLLAGIVSASLLSAIILFLMTTLSGRDLHGMTFWLMGDLSISLQQNLRWVLGVGFAVASGVIYTAAADLNLLLAGEKEAMHLGVDVSRVRLVVYLAASVLTGLAVSVSGVIGYVGLLVPHVMRLIFGSDHRVLIPAAAFGGAIAVVIADTLARTVVAPNELPVGAMTALAGAPLFLYLLRKGFA